MSDNLVLAAEGLDQFVRAAQSGKICQYGPLYSAVNIQGIANGDNPGTAQLNAQVLDFFQVSVGQTGQGFGQNRPLRLSETNLDGAPGQLPAGYSFIGLSCGVYLPPSLPMHIKDHFTRHSSLYHERHSHRWKMGSIQFWPCAEFGHQSKAVTWEVAGAQIQYGVNGSVGMRQFPKGGELYFPAKEVIKFTMDVPEPVFVTTDGLTWNGVAFGNPGSNQINPVDGALIYIIMEGWRFEALSA